MINKLRIVALAIAASAALCSTAWAQPQLSYGTGNTISLIENTAGQTVDIFASNVANMNLTGFQIWLQLGDGGTPVGGSDTNLAARMTAVDLFPSGTIFDTDNQSAPGGGQTDFAWIQGQDGDASEIINRDGLIAVVTFDTTGHFAGEMTNFMLDEIGGDPLNSSNFLDTNNDTIFADPARGTIILTAVPEPSSLAILGAVSVIGLIRRRRS